MTKKWFAFLKNSFLLTGGAFIVSISVEDAQKDEFLLEVLLRQDPSLSFHLGTSSAAIWDKQDHALS